MTLCIIRDIHRGDDLPVRLAIEFGFVIERIKGSSPCQQKQALVHLIKAFVISLRDATKYYHMS